MDTIYDAYKFAVANAKYSSSIQSDALDRFGKQLSTANEKLIVAGDLLTKISVGVQLIPYLKGIGGRVIGIYFNSDPNINLAGVINPTAEGYCFGLNIKNGYIKIREDLDLFRGEAFSSLSNNASKIERRYLKFDSHKVDDVILFLANFLRSSSAKYNSENFSYPDEVGEDVYSEGSAKTVHVNKYERSRDARDACIIHHGVNCCVCGFNFDDEYGEIGRGYIHIHHVLDIAQIGKEYTVDPIKDLIPVCPNCHAMLHTEKPSLSISALKAIVRERKHITKS